jgi:hypothetical protein
MRLGHRQIEVLRMMADGWELGLYRSLHGHWTLQEGGLGRGGETKRVGHPTAFGLYDKGLIDGTTDPDKLFLDRYSLTEKGKDFVAKLPAGDSL